MPLCKKENRIDFVMTAVIASLIIGYLIIFAIINFCGFEKLCTTDIYEDTLVARMMWEQKTLFPNYYVFGNQLYVLATPVLSALLYGLCGSMNLAMEISTTLMGLLTLLTLAWMLRPFVHDRLGRLCAILVFICAVYAPRAVTSDEGQLFFVLASFYSCYIISFFFLTGDYIRARINPRLRPRSLTLALLLSFGTGMQSLRQTCVCMLPILAFELLQAIRRLLSHRKPWTGRGELMPLVRAFAYLLVNLMGYGFSRLLHISQFTIYSELSPESSVLGAKLATLKSSLLYISGMESVKNGNFFFLLCFIFFTTILCAAAVLMLMRLKKAVTPLASCWWICLISLAAVVAASFVTSLKLRSIYLFIYYPLLALSFVIVLQELKPAFRNLPVVMLALLALGNAHFSYAEDVLLSVDDEKSTYQQISDFAVENGYELIYGCHSSTAPQVAVCSDGALIAGGWGDGDLFHAVDYINHRGIYYKEDNERALYVLMNAELDYALEEVAANPWEEGSLDIIAQIGDFTLCTGNRQFMYLPTEAWDRYREAWEQQGISGDLIYIR